MAIRKARLPEAVEILRRLLDGEEVSHAGHHHQLDRVRTMRARQDRLPILVGVNGTTALGHAVRHADTIGLNMLGRTVEDGQNHEVRWDPERIDRTVDHIRSEAGERWERPKLNAQAVIVTDDQHGAADKLAGRIPGLAAGDALVAPFLAVGTHAEIADHLVKCRQRWGISYFSARDIAAFAPLIERLR